MEEWKTIEPRTWKPEKEGDFIVGILKGKEPRNDAKELSARYYLDVEGEQTMLWGCATLDERMLSVNVEDKVKITFKEKKDIGKGKTLNIYQVEVAVPSNEEPQLQPQAPALPPSTMPPAPTQETIQ